MTQQDFSQVDTGLPPRRPIVKRPTWATVVGVLGIILGAFGIMGGGQLILMPTVMKFQKAMIVEMKKEFAKQEDEMPARPVPPLKIFDVFESMMQVPDWFAAWCIAAGFLAMIVSGFYLFSAIFLLLMRPSAVKLFYCAAGMKIGFSLVNGLAGLATMTFMGLSLLIGAGFSVVVNVVLLIVVATGDKTAFGG